MDLDPPLDTGTTTPDPHANSILRSQAGFHIFDTPLPITLRLQTGLHPDDWACAKLYRALWEQGLSGRTLYSFCEDIVPDPDLQAKYQDSSFVEKCFPINPDWADFFPPSIRSIYIRAGSTRPCSTLNVG